jgi:hypothetical protein
MQEGNPETSSWIRVRVRVGLRVRLRVRLRVIYIPAFPNVPVISEQLRFLFTSSKLVFDSIHGNPETSSWIRVRVTYTLAFSNVLVISEQLRFMFASSQLQTRVITFINMENET